MVFSEEGITYKLKLSSVIEGIAPYFVIGLTFEVLYQFEEKFGSVINFTNLELFRKLIIKKIFLSLQ